MIANLCELVPDPDDVIIARFRAVETAAREELAAIQGDILRTAAKPIDDNELMETLAARLDRAIETKAIVDVWREHVMPAVIDDPIRRGAMADRLGAVMQVCRSISSRLPGFMAHQVDPIRTTRAAIANVATHSIHKAIARAIRLAAESLESLPPESPR